MIGGLRAESWLDRLICGWLHRPHLRWTDEHGDRHRFCYTFGCSMHTVRKPLIRRVRAQALQDATDVLRGRR